eukprot:TRINITY_DN11442_c4_g2_i1.p1 TRINITY_DN11442_c4_g2~~TRINITY_DN11442_c4_g2_i1.p1  ORF type:complete len:141 (+),score=52.80 TRINITY_DN11442_c4_g2_i1:36-458(+)
MASGVAVNDAVVEAFTQMKMKHDNKYMIMRISEDLTEIVVESTVKSAEYTDFVSALPADDCRYAVYDFDYKLKDGGERSKLLFYVWCPDNSKIKSKMLYAASKDALKSKLVGFHYEIQATDLEEVEFDEIYEKVSAGGTK